MHKPEMKYSGKGGLEPSVMQARLEEAEKQLCLNKDDFKLLRTHVEKQRDAEIEHKRQIGELREVVEKQRKTIAYRNDQLVELRALSGALKRRNERERRAIRDLEERLKKK